MSGFIIPTPRRVSTNDLFFNAWIYGDPGVGKTTWAAGALDHPTLSPALFINIEGGLLSVAGRGDIDAVEISTPDDIDRITYAILTKHEQFSRYRTIIVDSLTELQDVSLRTIVGAAMAKNPGRDRSLDDIEIGDYGKSSTQMKRLVQALRNAPIHVIFTGLAKKDYPKGADPKISQPTAVGPSLTSKLADHCMGMMDFVWYMFKNEEGVRQILTSEYNQFKAKTRGSRFAEALGLVHANPHLPTIYDLLLSTEGTNNPNFAPPRNMGVMNPTSGVTMDPEVVLAPQNEEAIAATSEASDAADLSGSTATDFTNPEPTGSPLQSNGEDDPEFTVGSPFSVSQPGTSPFGERTIQVSSAPIPAGS